jgi:hypothetical protein
MQKYSEILLEVQGVHAVPSLAMLRKSWHINTIPFSGKRTRTITMSELKREILRTLLYFDIWEYPLNAAELQLFLHAPGTFPEELLRPACEYPDTPIQVAEGYFFVRGRNPEVVKRRRQRENHARRMWRVARISAHVIKRCPFVRGVFVSGDLSKNSTGPNSDVDFFVITAPGRLWLVRALLTLFKKIVLLNRKKYFCLNSFVTSDHLALDERNIYSAIEVATIQPLFGSALYEAFLAANPWVWQLLPNFRQGVLSTQRPNNRRSLMQWLVEFLLLPFPLERFDTALMEAMRRVWSRRYPGPDAKTHDQMFRSTPQESRAYVGNFQERILLLYAERLQQFGVSL